MDLTHAIVKITSRAEQNDNFGTGFVIYRDRDGDYVLTCKHVVNAVGREHIAVDGHPAQEIACGREDALDLAVLRVEPSLNRLPLALSASLTPCGEFVTRGYFNLSTSTYREDGYSATADISLSQNLTGRLDLQSPPSLEDEAGHCVSAWWLELPNAEYALQPGYSGSPVVDRSSGKVIGIISIRTDQGERGLAIAAQALELLWPQRPADLFVAPQIPQAEKPIINLDEERAAFTRIVRGEDTQTRLLLVHGEPGMGKTHLVRMYERIAAAYDRKTIFVDLEEQMSVERCLAGMVLKLGGSAIFPHYNKAKMQVIQAANATDEDKWELLTDCFFTDLKQSQSAIILIFDAYDGEKPEESFKRWLTDILLPLLAHQTRLVVVIAGQEPVTSPRELTRCHHNFPLTGVSVEKYQDYAAACQIELSLQEIELIHEVLGGKPAEFAYFIQNRQAKSQPREARYAG